MSTLRKNATLRMTQLAILTAIVVVLQCFGGLLRLPFMGTAGNLVLIPIAIGAILLGPRAGTWLGLVCGVVIYIYGVTGADPFTHLLFEMHPLITAAICFVKTALAGFLAALAWRALKGFNEWVALLTAAVLVPVVNTGVFVLGCFTILDAVEAAQASFFPGDARGTIAFIFLGLAGVNFLLELGLTLVLTPALQRIIAVLAPHITSKKK